MPEIPNSLFLDLTSYGTTAYTAATRVEEAYHISVSAAFETVNVAVILPRANDPTALLAGNWATRQKMLAEHEAGGTLWSTYGVSQAGYDAAVAKLTGTGSGQLGLKKIEHSHPHRRITHLSGHIYYRSKTWMSMATMTAA